MGQFRFGSYSCVHCMRLASQIQLISVVVNYFFFSLKVYVFFVCDFKVLLAWCGILGKLI